MAGDGIGHDVGTGDDEPAAVDSHTRRRDQIRRPATGRWLARPADVRGRIDSRRDNIMAEIERNRRGEFTVPTWVLAAVLVAIVTAIVAFVLFG